MFFFSSRRRHTRWPRDWSSDVCSSDLLSDADTSHSKGRSEAEDPEAKSGGVDGRARSGRLGMLRTSETVDSTRRSEERRVGKSVDRWGWRVSKQKRWERASVGGGVGTR